MHDTLLTLQRYSEPYAPTGNLGDTGIRKLLGAPTLDLLETLVRESVQNSCDAAKYGRGPEIRFRIRTLSQAEMEYLTDCVLADLPEGAEGPLNGNGRTHFPHAGDAPLEVLEIADLGTTGLAGPVRADRLPPDVCFTDFINFFRNVGAARDTCGGGGTYGFGKISLYLASACSTILVDTLTEVTGQRVRRFMACHIGPAHDVKDEDGSTRRYTGRHWWGTASDDDPVTDPVEGDAAVTAAAALGMPARQGPEDSGTTIMMLSPQLGGSSAREAGMRIAEKLLWHCWPRMTADTPDAIRMRASIEIHGEAISIPEPEAYPPLDAFAKALSEVRTGGNRTEVITMDGTRRTLGHCATIRQWACPRTPVDASSSPPSRAHAIALMRPVGFVVKYLEGPTLPDERFEWAGVFVADDDKEIEEAFARAEPPAHDDWQPKLLGGSDRRFVQAALRKLKQVADCAGTPPEKLTTATGGADESAVAIAAELGRLIGSDSGAPPTRPRGQAGRGRPRIVATVKPARLKGIGRDRNGRFADFEVDVRTGAAMADLRLDAWPVLDGGFARSLNGLALPEIRSVTGTDGELDRSDKNGSTVLPARFEDRLVVRVTLPDGMRVGLESGIQEREAA